MPNPHRRVAVIPSVVVHDSPIERFLARAIGPIHSVSQDFVTPVFSQAYIDDAMNLEDDRSHILQSSPHVRSTSSRQSHLVSTISQRLVVIQWMLKESSTSGEKGIAAKALKKFLHLFSGHFKANHAKATDWWKKRDSYMKTRN